MTGGQSKKKDMRSPKKILNLFNYDKFIMTKKRNRNERKVIFFRTPHIFFLALASSHSHFSSLTAHVKFFLSSILFIMNCMTYYCLSWCPGRLPWALMVSDRVSGRKRARQCPERLQRLSLRAPIVLVNERVVVSPCSLA